MLTSSDLVWLHSLNALAIKHLPAYNFTCAGWGGTTSENSAIRFKGCLLKEVEIGQNLLLKGTGR